MTVSVIKEGTCCVCCAILIANHDDSGCRGFHEHTHPSPFDTDHGGHLVIASLEDEVIVGPCELCGQGESGYMQGFQYAVLGTEPVANDDHDHKSETLGSCGCTDYHMADCPTRTASVDSSIYDDHELDGYYN